MFAAILYIIVKLGAVFCTIVLHQENVMQLYRLKLQKSKDVKCQQVPKLLDWILTPTSTDKICHRMVTKPLSKTQLDFCLKCWFTCSWAAWTLMNQLQKCKTNVSAPEDRKIDHRCSPTHCKQWWIFPVCLANVSVCPLDVQIHFHKSVCTFTTATAVTSVCIYIHLFERFGSLGFFYRWFRNPNNGGLFATTAMRKATFLTMFWSRWTPGPRMIYRWAKWHVSLQSNLTYLTCFICDILFPSRSLTVGQSWASDSGSDLHTCRGQSLAELQRFLQNVSEITHTGTGNYKIFML